MNGKITDCNKAFEKITGYNLEELRKINYNDLTPEKWHKIEDNIIKNQVIKKGYSEEYEKEYKIKDGRIINVSLISWLEKDNRNEPIGMWAIVRDVTNKKEVDEKVRLNEEKFEEIFNYSPIGIELYNSKGELEKINQAILKIFGVKNEKEVMGFKLFNDPNVSNNGKRALKRGEAIKYEVAFDFEKVKKFNLYSTKKEGIIYLNVVITPIKKGASGYLAMVEDITSDKNSQINLQEKLSELEKINKLMVGRELKMIELKDKIAKLEQLNLKAKK
jgi:PAS domain S-box-containing protein